MILAQKRAIIFNEWQLATMANNEGYYMATLWTGIPDVTDEAEALQDLKDGVYDFEIDDTIAMYKKVRQHYGKDGYYNYETGEVMTESEAKEFLRSKRIWRTRIGK